MASKTLRVEIVGDTADLERALGRSQNKLSSWRSGLEKAARVSKFALIGVGVAAFKATRDASDLNEMISATNVVFGKSAAQMLTWSKNTQDAFSQTDFLAAAKGFAVFAQQAGLGDKATADFSKTLLDAAGDLASFHDANPSEVLADIKSGLTGEAEPLRKYGILLSEAAVQQEAMRMGLVKGKAPLTEREKVLARQHLILSQLGAAQGDWNRTRDSAANQERTQIANAKDLSSQLGMALLPAYQAVLSIGLQVTAWMSKHTTATKIIIGVLTGMAAAVWLVNFALAANPFVLVVVAIAALGVALVVLWTKFKTFRNVVHAVWGWIKDHWPLLLAIIAGPIGIAVGQIIKHWGTLKDAATGTFNWLKDKFNAFVGFFKGLPGRISSAAKGMWNGVVQAFKDALNAIIGFWNNLSVGFDVPGFLPGPSHIEVGTPNIPMLAKGGIVSRPTLALLGERGPEAVVPLRGRGGAGVTNIFNFPHYVGDKRELAAAMVKADNAYRKRNGGRPLLG